MLTEIKFVVAQEGDVVEYRSYLCNGNYEPPENNDIGEFLVLGTDLAEVIEETNLLLSETFGIGS